MKEFKNTDSLDRLAELSVDVNGTLIPGCSTGNSLSRYTRIAAVFNDDETYKISLLGSMTAIRFNGREIALTTQHQLRGVDESRVGILTDTGSRLITSGGSRRYPPNAETDAYDIIAFDFSDPCKSRPELQSYFFDLRSPPPDTLIENVLAVLLTDYISKEQDYDIADNNHLGLVRRRIACRFDTQPSDDALLRVKPLQPLDKSPDGMSGGTAFMIMNENSAHKAYFAGIIVRGGQNELYIIKAGYVFDFLKSTFP